MNIAIGTNIFISSLIRDSITMELIVNTKNTLLFPEFEFYEIKKHKKEIIKKSKLSEKEFDILLLRLLNYIKVIPTNIPFEYQRQAEEIIGKIDSEDIIFIATALAFKCPIWSDDKHFQKQKKIKIFTTEDMFYLSN